MNKGDLDTIHLFLLVIMLCSLVTCTRACLQ